MGPAIAGQKPGLSAASDLTVTYFTLRSAYVDLKEVEKLEREGYKEQARIYDMGKLVVVVRERGTKRQLWAANTLEPLSPDSAAREQTINEAVVKVFQTYPTRTKQGAGSPGRPSLGDHRSDGEPCERQGRRTRAGRPGAVLRWSKVPSSAALCFPPVTGRTPCYRPPQCRLSPRMGP
jgi:hypothetical protein